MEAIKIMKAIAEIENFLDDGDLKLIERMRRDKLELDKPFNVASALYMLYEQAKDEERQRLNKQNGNAKVEAVIKRIFKENKRNNKENLNFAFVHGDRYAFCNGFYLFTSKDNLGYEMSQGFNTLAATQAVKENCMHEAKINLAELKLYIAEQKQRKKRSDKEPVRYTVLYDNGNKIMCFNAQFLIDVLEALGTDTILLPDFKNKPAWLENEQGESGMLLPVNLKDAVYEEELKKAREASQ